MARLTLLVVIVFVALVFDFLNGFHDAANAIATVVSTRVLSPRIAVVWAAFFNFAAVFFVGTAVAETIGEGIVDARRVNLYVIIAGLIGAIFWDIFTWYFGLPVSSSHGLMGGYAGAAIAKAGWKTIIWKGWVVPVLFIFLSPTIGLLLAYLLMIAAYWIFRNFSPARLDAYFRKLQLLSSAAVSFSHGANDSQKTMGIIATALVAAGLEKQFTIPVWVILLCYTMMAMGTLAGGWRIVKTMGVKITKLRPMGGFCAETAAAISILGTALGGIPVSTTHTIAGGVMGVGSTQRLSAVRWGVAKNILWAWVLTIPISALVAAFCFLVIHQLVPAA